MKRGFGSACHALDRILAFYRNSGPDPPDDAGSYPPCPVHAPRYARLAPAPLP
jgi:hypothetical protein